MSLIRTRTVYLSAFLVAFSGVAYELLLASYATFLMGSSVMQYSFVISLMMASMGIGAYLPQLIKRDSKEVFLWAEISLSLIALFAIPILYIVFALNLPSYFFLIFFVLLMGIFLGMEIPLLSSVLNTPNRIAEILFFDYLGGFVGGILFPLYFLPKLGFFRLAAALSLLNILVGGLFFITFISEVKKVILFKWILIGLLVICGIYFIGAEKIRTSLELYYFQIQY